MPVPFEALLPYGIMLAFFGVSGGGLTLIRTWNNGGKRQRYCVGKWDYEMMRRDRRLTGWMRGQTDKVEAPPGFEVNNPWQVEEFHRI